MTRFSVRGLALGAVAMFTIALCPATAGVAGAAVPPGGPTLTASPDSQLADGQTITVTATGYPTNHSLDLVQCVQDQGCDYSNLQVLYSGDSGGYTTTLFVRRLMHLDQGVQVDCAVAQNCILVSLDITDLSAGAQTSITFDPNSPFLPPLHFRFAPNPTDPVRLDTGVARVSGVVHCNQAVEIGAYMELVQIWHRNIFRSEQYLDISCSGTTRFTAVFRPVNGLFGTGAARLHIEGYGSTSTSYDTVKNMPLMLVASP